MTSLQDFILVSWTSQAILLGINYYASGILRKRDELDKTELISETQEEQDSIYTHQEFYGPL